LENDPAHQGVQRLVRDLNVVYKTFPALHSQDVNANGFQWVSHNDAAQSVVAFLRWSKEGECMLVVCNFTPVPRYGYRLGVPRTGAWREIINSDNGVYGGSGMSCGPLSGAPVPAHGHTQSLLLDLPPLSTAMLALVAD
jgi:1,4-alpha-glucan branching enzyme